MLARAYEHHEGPRQDDVGDAADRRADGCERVALGRDLTAHDLKEEGDKGYGGNRAEYRGEVHKAERRAEEYKDRGAHYEKRRRMDARRLEFVELPEREERRRRGDEIPHEASEYDAAHYREYDKNAAERPKLYVGT